MTILWCGGEDIDFNTIIPGTSNTYYDGSFARNSMIATETTNGASTNSWGPSNGVNLWISCKITTYGSWAVVGSWIIGIVNEQDCGPIIGFNDGGTALVLKNTNNTILASGSLSFTNGTDLRKLDINIINYGISGTVNVYINGIRHITYTGDIRPVYGATTLSKIKLYLCVYRNYGANVSEIIVADEDTRLMRLKTLVPSADGDTNDWTGAYTNVNETTLSDSTIITSPSADNTFNANLTGMPAGTFQIKAVKIATRMTTGPSGIGIQSGIKTNGNTYLGSTKQAIGYWETKEELYSINPDTGVQFTDAEIESLQIAHKTVSV